MVKANRFESVNGVAVEEPRAAANTKAKRVRIVTVAVIAAVFYNSWILLAFLNPRLPVSRSFLSEYAVTTEPYAWVAHLGDLVAALSVLVIAIALARRDVVKTAFYLFTVGTIIDGFFPMPCLETVSSPKTFFQNCSGLQSQLHAISSTLAGIALIFAIIGWSLTVSAYTRSGARHLEKMRAFIQRQRWLNNQLLRLPLIPQPRTRKGKAWLRLGIAAGLIFLLANVWMVCEIATGHMVAMGYAQRLSVFAIGVWWIVVASQLPLRQRRAV